ncbi:hypothetical protein ROA7450_02618 [Roseovarius albus]|uniref:Uncharacterized protein n=1 Tax=Roseovarius albus TaxID=1247867 RepID=A0A1X6ZHM4_9RHOB|nr:hypothetical protein ROA7450_02618 [Roseovarius albus]
MSIFLVCRHQDFGGLLVCLLKQSAPSDYVRVTYAAGPGFLLISLLLFAVEIFIYLLAHKDRAVGAPLFFDRNGLVAGGLTALAILALAIILTFTGIVGTGLW